MTQAVPDDAPLAALTPDDMAHIVSPFERAAEISGTLATMSAAWRPTGADDMLVETPNQASAFVRTPHPHGLYEGYADVTRAVVRMAGLTGHRVEEPNPETLVASRPASPETRFEANSLRLEGDRWGNGSLIGGNDREQTSAMVGYLNRTLASLSAATPTSAASPSQPAASPSRSAAPADAPRQGLLKRLGDAFGGR